LKTISVLYLTNSIDSVPDIQVQLRFYRKIGQQLQNGTTPKVTKKPPTWHILYGTE